MPPTASGNKSINLKRIYKVLLLVRLCFALFGPGYIHPDEHYQNGEVIAGRQLGVFTARTWEWEPDFACRSIITPATSTGIPYTMFLRWIWWKPENIRPLVMFLVERLTFFILSLTLDHTVCQLVSNPADRLRALVLLASSYVMHTFQVRPFSNSIEAIIVAMSLSSYKSLIETEWNRSLGTFSPDLISLAIYCVMGVFTRPTFLAFILPVGVQTLVWTYHHASYATLGQPRRAFWAFWLRLVGMPVAAMAMYTLCFSFVDTVFFREGLSGWVFTPLNFLRYNLSSSNLADHGLHPRWLHLLVNLPLIVGPGLLYYGIRATRQLWSPLPTPLISEKSEKETSLVAQTHVFKMPLFVIVSSVAILSAFRHQEPRFLVPLLVPFIALIAEGSQLKRLGSLFWISWIVSNVILATLFGVLHQGGVVPSLINMHDRLGALSHNAPPELTEPSLAWSTGRHVASGKYVLSDLTGIPSEEMLERVVDTQAQETFLRGCFELQERFFPHLDLDHVPEAMALGWKEGMSLGIYSVDMTCLRSESVPVKQGKE
ncbi:Alg9-like mannosyltransferase family-domain-containing protein [Fomitopsis serialis]|uniref:Alg9-like mannosyltransferase family-domain-containing protein n=1 Tax=Fomitopsis serialis TaxID=139415 RepID=UPI0020073DDF|nr:Alg9-like mannosyltransferase family-domain-containing protein [Neoantrodia serialis]KAH9930751.1 Alg9-like mannosyltransferase family-domain-containing protein [Neoantrodia serialis]